MSESWPELSPHQISVVSAYQNYRAIEKTPLFTVKTWSFNIYRGSGSCELFDGKNFTFTEGDMVVFPPFAQRQFNFTRAGFHEVIHFQAPDCSHPEVLVIKKVEEKPFRHYFSNILASYAMEPERANANLLVLLYELKASYDLQINHRPSQTLVQRACALIASQGKEVLALAQMAKDLGVSHNHLTREFKKEVGMTIKKYVMHQKFQQLKDLVQLTNYPLKAISAELGFQNLQAFNKFIHTMANTTPRQLELQLRKLG